MSSSYFKMWPLWVNSSIFSVKIIVSFFDIVIKPGNSKYIFFSVVRMSSEEQETLYERVSPNGLSETLFERWRLQENLMRVSGKITISDFWWEPFEIRIYIVKSKMWGINNSHWWIKINLFCVTLCNFFLIIYHNKK